MYETILLQLLLIFAGFEALRKSYCDMDLDQKRNLLLSSSVTAEEAEDLLASSRYEIKTS